MAAESLSTEELLRQGSESRRLTDWMLESSEISEQQTAMALLGCREASELLIRYLKERRLYLNDPVDAEEEA